MSLTTPYEFALQDPDAPYQVPDIHVLRGQDPRLWVKSEADANIVVTCQVSEDQETWVAHGTLTIKPGARDVLNITRTTGDDSPYVRFIIDVAPSGPIFCSFEVFTFNPQLQAGLDFSP